MSFTKQPFAPCPVCNANDITFLLQVKDYSLTQENFQIIECENCNLKYTDPIPSVEEIAPYYNFPSYISHTDIKEGWMNKIYHNVRVYTLAQKTSWIQSLFTGHKGNLLEVGAGTGAFSNAMQMKGWNVTALEPDASSRKKAFENYSINLLPIDQLYSLEDAQFDVITLWHVLEHVHDLKKQITAFKRLLKPTGRLIIAVPNYTSFDAQFYNKFWAAYDVPRHLYHFSPKAMRYLMNEFELKVMNIKPMWFDSFYVSLLSEKYKNSGTIGVIRAFFIGLISNIKAMRNNDKASSIIYTIKKIDDI